MVGGEDQIGGLKNLQSGEVKKDVNLFTRLLHHSFKGHQRTKGVSGNKLKQKVYRIKGVSLHGNEFSHCCSADILQEAIDESRGF